VPAMVAVVIFTAISQIKFELGVGSKEVIAALLSYMNWLRAFGYSDGGRLGHYWSLSVEEQFYILWPLFFIFLSNFKRISIIKIIISVIFVSFLWKILIFENFASYERLYNGLDVRVDGLLAGALINFINFKSNAIKQIILFLALGGFCIFGYGHSGFYQITAKPIETIISFLIVCSFSHGKSIFSIILNSKLFQWAGSRSYGIYLWHYPLIGISTEFFREIGVRGAVYIAISLLITCIFSEISYRTIERPAMKLRKIIESKMNAQEIRSSDAN
jgi:peptidoglycan/LPS O-acetylase OafA/YrhL